MYKKCSLWSTNPTCTISPPSPPSPYLAPSLYQGTRGLSSSQPPESWLRQISSGTQHDPLCWGSSRCWATLTPAPSYCRRPAGGTGSTDWSGHSQCSGSAGTCYCQSSEWKCRHCSPCVKVQRGWSVVLVSRGAVGQGIGPRGREARHQICVPWRRLCGGESGPVVGTAGGHHCSFVSGLEEGEVGPTEGWVLG